MFSSNAKSISKQEARTKEQLLNRASETITSSINILILTFDASTDNVQRIRYFYYVIQKMVITQDRSKTILCRNSGNLFGSLDI